MTMNNDPVTSGSEYMQTPDSTPGVRRSDDQATPGMVDKARDKAQEAADKARDAAEEARRLAGDASRQAAAKVDDAMTVTGDRMSDVARTLRERAPTGQAGDVAENAARALERGGDYLRRSDVQAVRRDLETIVRDHPIESLAVGLGIGFLLARSMRSRRSYYG
jgi:ElaB/YqjD/DUF883 family membrane-anchored ribosome-binding protein